MEINKAVRQYVAIKNELTLLTSRQTQLKSELMAALDNERPDEKGHKTLQVNDEVAGEVTMIKQRRVSKELDMAVAEELLTKKGIKDACVKMVPVLDESAIMTAFYEGYLTEEDIDTMFPAKETYAFLFKN